MWNGWRWNRIRFAIRSLGPAGTLLPQLHPFNDLTSASVPGLAEPSVLDPVRSGLTDVMQHCGDEDLGAPLPAERCPARIGEQRADDHLDVGEDVAFAAELGFLRAGGHP